MITFAKNTYEKTSNKKRLASSFENKIFRKNKFPKLSRQIISEIIAILGFIVLTAFFKVEGKIFDEISWKRDAENCHLGLEKDNPDLWKEYHRITDVRSEVDKYIIYLPKYGTCLDEICRNPVGNTMLRIMLAKMQIKSLYEPVPVFSILDGDTCAFSKLNKCIYMTDSYFDGSIDIQLCGMNERGIIVPIIPTKAQALFHELCHAFHVISGTRKESGDTRTLEHLYHGNNKAINCWKGKRSSDEELYNITGYYSHDCGRAVFDPINCNMYDICDAYMKHQELIQRVLYPRYKVYEEHKSRPYMRSLLTDTRPILMALLKYFY